MRKHMLTSSRNEGGLTNLKCNAFTLIELLAIIVILAIIAVITVPIILNIIENSKIGAAKNSAYGYKDAVEKYFVSELYNDKNIKLNGEYEVSDGVLNGNDIDNVEIPLSGKKPINGVLNFSNNKLSSGCLTIDDYKILFEEGKIVNTLKGTCFERYTVTFNSNGGTTVESIRTLGGESITKPTNPTKENTTFLGWYREEELTNKFDFSTPINEDITLYAKWGEPSLNDDSWDEIVENITKNRNYYPIGTTKTIRANFDGTEKNYKLRLVNTTPCTNSTATSKTSCGVVIEFVTVVGNHNMNSTNTNAGGWYSSSMRSYLNSDIYNNLPNDLKSIIINTNPVVSGSGVSGNSQNASDYLYLLSTRELGFTGAHDNKNSETDTNILNYYSTSNPERRKFETPEGTQGVCYWLRTAYLNYADRFASINYNGALSETLNSDSCNAAPAFRILD